MIFIDDLVKSNLDFSLELIRLRKENEDLKLKYNQDITIQIIPDSKQVESALTASEIRYRRLFETAKDGILILDAETGKIVDVNPFLIQLLGYSKEQFVEKEIWQLGLFKDILANKDKFLELQQKEYVRYEDLPLETDHGKKINVEFVSNVYLVNQKKVIQCNIRDISERKIMEKALLQSEEKFRSYIDNSPIGIFIVDDKGIYKDCNLAAHNLIGYTREELLTLSIPDIIPFEDNDKGIQGFNELIETGSNHSEINLLRKDRSKVPVLLDSVKLPNKNMYIGFCTDISKRKQAELELIIEKEHAEESDNLKTAFLQNMSHEIRTPLNGIIGFSRLLSSDNLSTDEIKEFINLINLSGDRLIEIVNNILDMSKIQTGQANVNIKPIFINSLFSDLYDFFYHLAESKHIRLSYHFVDYKDKVILTDESKLNQILTNLINNALKFTKSGNIDYGFDIIDNNIQFYVKDTGVGVPQDLFGRIFERFAQAEQSTSRNYEGAGLGLAICKGLVELLGGKIWLESELGIGSTFFFTIPKKQELIDVKIENEVSHYSEKKSKGTILIAEDDWVNIKLLTRILEFADFTVIHAENGLEAVEMVKTSPEIDLILMDIKMKIMDGIEATKLIRTIRPELPIIAQTAYDLSDEKQNILSIGFDEYIAKPYDINKLISLIDENLK